MNDPPGAPSPLGIEVVEWFSEGGENLTVRVTGRWRRRRPAWSAQPTLVIEAPGRRYRFPAMPEPPSLTGTAPGMWRISFSVPAALAPDLGGRTWLQFGAVIVPLPAAVEPFGVGALESEPEAAALAPAHPPPGSESDPGAGPGPGEGPQPSPELEAETTRRRAAEAEAAMAELSARVGALEDELAQARTEAQQLSGSLVEQQTSRRAAEQRAHSERAQRLDLARRLADRSRDSDRAREALGELAAAEQRVRELELELAGARRRIDEAEQAAATAGAARERAERRASEAAEELERRAPPPPAPSEAERERLLALEHSLVARHAAGTPRVPLEPRLPAVPASPAVVPEPEIAEPATPGADALISALRSELDQRAGAEAGLRARLVDAEVRLAARPVLERRTTATLAQLRDELDGLGSSVRRERGAREAAERRAAELERELDLHRARTSAAYEAITEVRGVLEFVRASIPESVVETKREPVAEPEAEVEVEAEAPAEAAETPQEVTEPEEAEHEPERAEHEPTQRLSEALVRLRQVIEPLDLHVEEPNAAAGPEAMPTPPVPADEGKTGAAWLRPVFLSLVGTDPDRAGRLLVALLPAQRAVDPTPLAYDLVLGGHRGCWRVTVDDPGSRVVFDDLPRPSREVDFQVFGDYAAVARLLTSRGLRRLRRGVARVRGDRKRAAVLEQLIGVRLDLRGLHDAGVRIQPRTLLTVIAQLIDPAWTAGVEFVLAYESPPDHTVYLTVADGSPAQITDVAPEGKIAARVTGPIGSLELLLAGTRPEDAVIVGDDWPLALLREWIKRAQSG